MAPKWRESIFSDEKPKSFQDPMAGPGPWPIMAHFVCAIPLCRVGKIRQKIIVFFSHKFLAHQHIYSKWNVSYKFSTHKEDSHVNSSSTDLTFATPLLNGAPLNLILDPLPVNTCISLRRG